MSVKNSSTLLKTHSDERYDLSHSKGIAYTYFEHGNLDFDRGNYPCAIDAYRKALHLAPEMVAALFKCGVAFHLLGRFEEAVSHYRQAIQHSPRIAEIHYNLADACSELKQFNHAEAAYQEALRLQPNYAEAAYNLGCLYESRGQYSEAFDAFKQALRIRPNYAEAFIHIGLIWKMQNRLEEALICFEQSLQCAPDLAAALYNIGFTHQLMGGSLTARQYYRRALECNPKYAPARWMLMLALPILYSDALEIQKERDRFSANLLELVRATPLNSIEEKQLALQGLGAYTHYFLAYQGQNDLALQKSFGQWVVNIMAANYPQWSQTRRMPPVTAGGKIRIGYVSSCMYAHSVGIFLLSWFKYLGLSGHRDGIEDLEFFCYHIGEKTDALTSKIQNISDHFHHFRGSVANAAAQIDNDDLHILVHTDIGVTAPTLQLAGLRLAPVQCAYWGHPVTTGLPTIDYYLSSELMEPDDGPAHYSETLIRLPGLAMNYSAPSKPDHPKSRKMLGIPDDAVVFLNCQSLFKYLPQNDDIFPRIAREIPKALFVFFSHENDRVTVQFSRRLESAFQEYGVPARILMMPRLNHMDFLSFNLAADVFLDTFEWSGGQTTLDALACDLPVVTLPGSFMRGRQTYGYLRLMGVTQTVATDKNDYIRLAVQLGRNPDFRNSIRDHIHSRKALLFENHQVNGALAHFFRQLTTQTQPLQAGQHPTQDLQSLSDSADALYARGQLDEAAELYRRILTLDPNEEGALNNLGNIYNQQGRFDEAFQCYRRMVELAPDMPQAHYNLGSALRNNENFDEALIHLQRAVEIQPDYAEAWNNLALTWKNIGEIDRSLSCFNRAVELAPKLAVARWNRSFVFMLKEDYTHGWLDFLWRFAIPNWKTIYPFRLQGNRWDGRPLPGQTVLVHDEQGLGDTLQFVRYLPLVRARCGKVILETRQELVDVLGTADGIDQLIVRSSNGRPRADYHAYVPLMSLPLLFRTTPSNVPNQVPYLFADPGKVAHWRQRFPAIQPTVGLMWAGRPQHTNDHNRSIPLRQLMPVLRVPGVRFIGLQKGPAQEQIRDLPPEIALTNIGPELNDFSDTAALLSNLDLVITVDTAVAHLAGAMGVPVWLLVPYIPDWRWAMDRTDTPWYPTMRLFRQPRRKAWDAVIITLKNAIAEHFNQTGTPLQSGVA